MKVKYCKKLLTDLAKIPPTELFHNLPPHRFLLVFHLIAILTEFA